MPPRTRTRATKDEENVHVVKKTKVKSDGKITKPPRKAFADKTNSLSDDNASIDVQTKTSKAKLKNKAAKTVSKDGIRPRRDRRLPTRYVENQVLNNLSNNRETPVENQRSMISVNKPSPMKLLSKDEQVKPHSSKDVEVELIGSRPKRNVRLQSVKELPATKKPETPSKQGVSTVSPFKTPSQSFNNSLIANRPKRICRLPSKFEDHSMSPNKFIPVKPCYASTPIIEKKTKIQIRAKSDDSVTEPVQEKRRTRRDKNNVKKDIKNTKGIEHYFSKVQKSKRTNVVKDSSSSSKDQTSPDSNNNPKAKRMQAKKVVSTKSPIKQLSPKANIKTGFAKRLLEKNLSFRVFEDRKSKDKNEDIYEFTFDPSEEPPPQKKKRKKVVKKRPTKPKTVVFKNNYDQNVQKALQSLKNKVKSSQNHNAQPTPPIQSTLPQNQQTDNNTAGKIQIIEDIIIKPAAENKSLNYTPALPTNDSAKSIHMSNYASICVEDIAADFEMENNDLNYSPVNSPCRAKTPDIQISHLNDGNIDHDIVYNKDPLNLQGESFFNDQPVASSSMNISVRHPLASPWRVEFGNLPIRWQANTYVKSNMTPAVESSFINSEEISKNKHVYTNLVAEEPLDDPPILKQPSIISFMREVAERSLKKKRGRSISPTKANSLFEDTTNFGYKTPKKARKEKIAPHTPNRSNDRSCEKETNHDNSENHNEFSNENPNLEEKSIRKSKKNKDGTFFGFDESYDQENVSPIKNVHQTRARGLRSKSRAVLQEINAFSGPTRAILPVTAKLKLPSSDVVEKMYEQLKSAEHAPALPENRVDESATNDEPSSDDDHSVHLFEDIEVVHHMKVTLIYFASLFVSICFR